MTGDSYAQSELSQESWNDRLERVTNDTNELIAATRKMITQSRESLARANESLKMRP